MIGPITLTPIGIIRSPHQQSTGTPVQPAFAQDIEGRIELLPEYAAGLKDLEGFERIWLLYWLDRAAEPRLSVTPFLDTVQRGIFATRAPCRPNSIGISCVRLRRIDGNVLTILDVDILDGTPLLDIKPYVPAFDSFEAKRIGWFGTVSPAIQTADDRFETK